MDILNFDSVVSFYYFCLLRIINVCKSSKRGQHIGITEGYDA